MIPDYCIESGGAFLPGAPLYEKWRVSLATTPPGFDGIHPIANLFPMIVEDDIREVLRESLAERQNHPVVLLRGALLDGRNRARELIALNKPISYVEFSGTDRQALDFVAAENYARRHLTDKQRTIIAARMANMRVGNNQHTRQVPSIEGTSATPPLFAMRTTQDHPDEAEAKPLISIPEAAQAMHSSVSSTERASVMVKRGIPELQDAVEYGPISISAGEKIARLPEAEQPAALEKALPSGARAIMSSRQEPDDSLDFFPTPPWAVRALCEEILIPWFDAEGGEQFEHLKLWEPACGEGHMAEVLREYAADVLATDIFDYGYGDRTLDFLSDLEVEGEERDFIITNPPFGDKTEGFVLQGLRRARIGIAMFVRLQWLETGGRYERIFKTNPPTQIVFYAERVNLCKGRWEPEGSTATAYIWLIWIKGEEPRAPRWIPPTCRKSWTFADDAERFTAHPVTRRNRQLSEDTEAA